MKFVLQSPEKYNFSADTLSERGCRVPFKKIGIHQNGDISICCYSWLPKFCGNILTSSPAEILENITRTEILNDMSEGKFTHCTDKCPILSTYLSSGADEWKLLVPIESLLSSVQEDRYIVALNYDRSCNLQCPSCRKGLILHKLGEVTPESILHTKAIEFVDHLLLKGEKIRLNITGSGDPFASPLYWSYLKELSTRVLPDNFSIKLMTNGVLMTEATWDEIKPLWKYIFFVEVSVDAATETTYNIIRKNGNFTRLKKNLILFDQMVLAGKFPQLIAWQTNMVVQAENYKELKAFVDWQLTYKSLKNIYTSKIDHWGHLSNDEFERLSRINIAELTEILTDPVFKNPRIKMGNLSGLVK